MVPPTATKADSGRDESSADDQDTHGSASRLCFTVTHNSFPGKNGVTLGTHFD
jgi:hypothetical protein